jgi:hypothetical protein
MKKDVTRMQNKVSSWVGEWVVGSTQKKIFIDGPHKVLNDYLSGEDNSELLSLRVDRLRAWHFNRFLNGTLNEGECLLDDLALSAQYCKASVKLEETFANIGSGGSILLHQAAFSFSLNVIAGWKDEAMALGGTLLRGLDTSLLDLRHTERHQAGELYRHFWFLMHLYSEFAGVKLDTSSYSYPEDMEPYANVLANWKTSDHDQLQTLVSQMADFHVQEARTTKHEDIAEFDEEDRKLFPYEILAFLRFREWMGLVNPETFEHPLMQTQLAKLPKEVPLAQLATPLLDQVIAKFKQEYPGAHL